MKVTRVSNATRVLNAEITIHGAVRKLAVPCFSNSPKLEVGTGRPKPKKSNAVIEEIAPTIVKGIKVTKVDKMFGMICRKIIRELEAPMMRAAAI